MDVLGGRHRPVALLGWVVRDVRAPVYRTPRAQLLEHLVRRSVRPGLALDDEQILKVAANGRHLALPIVVLDRCADHTGRSASAGPSGLAARLLTIDLQLADGQLVDVQIADAQRADRGALDRQAPDRHGAQRGRAACERTDRERSDRLGTYG